MTIIIQSDNSVINAQRALMYKLHNGDNGILRDFLNEIVSKGTDPKAIVSIL